MSGAKGAARERELVNRFHKAGWGALRLGASGAGGDADLPDVFAGRNLLTDYGQAWAIELKSGKQTTLYVGPKEVDDLLRFAETWGAQALLGARFTFGAGEHRGKTATYLVGIEHARLTDGGRSGLPVDDIEDRALAVVSDDGVRVP